MTNRKNRLQRPQELLKDWDEYFEELDSQPPRGLSYESWLTESAVMYQVVQALTREEAQVFQALVRRDYFDYVGPKTVRMFGLEWRNCGPPSLLLAEPAGEEDIREVSVQMAHEIRSEELWTREKKDGVYFSGNGQQMKGTFVVHAPYKKAEFVRGVFYVFDELKTPAFHDGWEFRPHLFRKGVRASEEGLVLRWQNQEYKWKFFPTVEVKIVAGQYQGLNVANLPIWLNEGVCEVYFSGERAVYVRERFNKKEGTYSTWLQKSSLHFYRGTFSLGLTTAFDIADSVSWAHVAEDGEIRIYPIPKNLQEYTEQISGGIESYAYKEVQSAKATFRYADGSFAVIKEEHKVWDFVGGELKKGETPEQAIKREMDEEIGVVLPFVKKAEILRISNFVLYKTYLYEIDPSSRLDLFESARAKTVVPWFHVYMRERDKFLKTNIQARRKVDVVEKGDQAIKHFQFDPQKYRQLCMALRKYPGLAYRRRITVSSQELQFIGTYSYVKGKWYYELDWDNLPLSILCLWAENHPRGGCLPFGLSKKKMQDWREEAEKRCPLCRVPSEKVCGSCQVLLLVPDRKSVV